MTTTQKPTTRKAPAKRASRGQRPHDAAATMKLISDATVRLLAEKGFPGIGINTVAAAAGVDKQLIYYHFGGLEGVIRHLGGQLELWLGTPLHFEAGEAYGNAVHRLLMEYVGALRRNHLVLRLLAWELVEPTDVLKELEVTRSKAMAGWIQGLRASAQAAPTGVDAPAVNAILLAGLHYLALREQSLGTSKPVRNFLSTVMPIGIGLSVVKYAATGKQSGVGEISGELKLTDAATGELLGAAVDRRVGGKAPQGIWDTWYNADEALKYWAKKVRFVLCERRGASGCVKP